jgi:parallel beta-helix repeat protein
MHQAIRTILPMLAFAWASSGEAATYYVRNGGNDSADGRSHGTAWASLNKVNSYGFAAGDVVLLHEGSRFVNQTLKVDWAGTATQHAVVGAYYLDGSTPRRGYRTARPTIDGEDRIPTGHYDGLVVVEGGDRVRIENLQVMNSEGRAIVMADSNEAEVVGCHVDNTYSNGIQFLRSPRSLAENNFVTGQGVGNREDGAPWGASIEFVASPDGVIRNNVVSEVFGEGINAHSGSDRTLIERNYVFGAYAVGIYLDSSADLTVRRNIVIGTANTTYWRTGSTVGAGIALNNELYHYPEGGGSLSTSVQAKRAKIYGNLVAYTSTGLTMWGQLSSTSFDGTLIYNNTFVDNNTQVNMGSKPKPNSRFINNILLSLSSGTSDVGGTSLSGMVARNNYFSRGNPGGDYAHAGNRFTGSTIAKMSGWRAVTSREQISWRDFVVASGSSVIGAGDDEPRRTSDITNDYVLDHNKAEHGSPMDMGGLTFATPVVRRPMAPTALSGT